MNYLQSPMLLAPMQPTPSRMHDSPYDNSPFFLWIHVSSGMDQVVAFKSLKDACKAAEDYVFIDCAVEAPKPANHEDYYGALWTAASGKKWCVPNLDWVTPMSSIVDDIQNGVEPIHGGWLVVATDSHQMIVGQGSDLPATEDMADIVGKNGYRYVPDVTDYSTSMDVSGSVFRARIASEPLGSEPAAAASEPLGSAPDPAATASPALQELEPPTPLTLGPYKGRHWLSEEVGERTPHVITPQKALLVSLQSYLRSLLGLAPAPDQEQEQEQEPATPQLNLQGVD